RLETFALEERTAKHEQPPTKAHQEQPLLSRRMDRAKQSSVNYKRKASRSNQWNPAQNPEFQLDESKGESTESWNPTESHGIQWNPTESHRISQNPMESWNPKESKGI
ncbi:unnamed protein product, partial [Didymodactylos carnosus]